MPNGEAPAAWWTGEPARSGLAWLLGEMAPRWVRLNGLLLFF